MRRVPAIGAVLASQSKTCARSSVSPCRWSCCWRAARCGTMWCGSDPIAWFVIFFSVGGIYLWMMSRKVVCPNCGTKRPLKNRRRVTMDFNRYDVIDYGKQAQDYKRRILAFMEEYDKTGKPGEWV